MICVCLSLSACCERQCCDRQCCDVQFINGYGDHSPKPRPSRTQTCPHQQRYDVLCYATFFLCFDGYTGWLRCSGCICSGPGQPGSGCPVRCHHNDPSPIPVHRMLCCDVCAVLSCSVCVCAICRVCVCRSFVAGMSGSQLHRHPSIHPGRRRHTVTWHWSRPRGISRGPTPGSILSDHNHRSCDQICCVFLVCGCY